MGINQFPVSTVQIDRALIAVRQIIHSTRMIRVSMCQKDRIYRFIIFDTRSDLFPVTTGINEKNMAMIMNHIAVFFVQPDWQRIYAHIEKNKPNGLFLLLM